MQGIYCAHIIGGSLTVDDEMSRDYFKGFEYMMGFRYNRTWAKENLIKRYTDKINQKLEELRLLEEIEPERAEPSIEEKVLAAEIEVLGQARDDIQSL